MVQIKIMQKAQQKVYHRVGRLYKGLVEGYFLNNMTPNFMGLFYVTETPNIMGLSYVLSYRGLSYVPETPNIMGLSYVEWPLFNMGPSY